MKEITANKIWSSKRTQKEKQPETSVRLTVNHFLMSLKSMSKSKSVICSKTMEFVKWSSMMVKPRDTHFGVPNHKPRIRERRVDRMECSLSNISVNYLSQLELDKYLDSTLHVLPCSSTSTPLFSLIISNQSKQPTSLTMMSRLWPLEITQLNSTSLIPNMMLGKTSITKRRTQWVKWLNSSSMFKRSSRKD